MFLFILAVTGLGVLGVWAGPRVFRALIGESLLVTVTPTMVIEEPVSVGDDPDDEVLKTIATLEIYFPMGSAPEHESELQVLDNEGRAVEVHWPAPQRDDIPDKKQTRWIMHPVFFPPGFRQGTLKNKVRELAQIRLQQPPYNSK